MAHIREKRREMSQKEEENSKILLKERYDLLKWSPNVEMRTPNLMIPVQIANYVESLPFCKLAVSPKCDRVALMSYARQLDIYQMSGEILEHESSVQVLEETSPEYCLLQFSSSGTLLLSSRSTPHIDVFDNMGAYCYDIPLEAHEGIFDVNTAVCGMQTLPNNSSSSSDKFSEILYVLQYSGVFSAFKIGLLSKYTRMCLLLVAAHHKESKSVTPPAGLCSFRMMDMDPYVEPIRISTPEGGIWSRFPFSASSMCYLPKLSLSFDSQLLVSVATSGSLYLFEIPSLRIRFSFSYISGPRPVEACFVDIDDMAVLYDNGYLLRCTLEDLKERMYTMKTKTKIQQEETDQKDIYNEHSFMISPARREIFLLTADGDNSVLREAAHKRVQLAGQLWFYTVWNSFKKLLGMAMGEPAEQLMMATHMAKFEFALIHSPTRTLQELFDRTLVEHDYARARELAETYETIDIDVVLKSEWADKCAKNKLSVEDVTDILHRIGDSEWVAAQCANADSDDLEVHRALIDLGLSLGESSITWQIRLLHHLRILKVCGIKGDVDAYMVARKQSCLEAALHFAHIADIDSLEQIIESNIEVMRKHQKRILSAIPSCTSPTKYERLMPMLNEDGKEVQWELEEKHDGIFERLHQILIDHPDAEHLVRNVNVGNIADEEEFDFAAWVRETLLRIDFECGITENCVNLLIIAKERGYDELIHDFGMWERYAQYIRICSSVSESITSFQDSSLKSFTDRFAHLLEAELTENAGDVVGLIDWKVNQTESEQSVEERIRESVTSLLKQTNERTTRVLVAFREERPDVVDDHVILEVLLSMTSTGADLMKSLGDLPVQKYSNVTSSLGSLMSRGVEMTFKAIFESMREPDGAKRVLIKLSRCGNCRTVEDWTSLRDDVYDMAKGIYGGLVTTEEALELFARDMLEDERIGSHPELMHLVLTLKPDEQHVQNEKKLGMARSADVLLEKSDELMAQATQRNDPLLGKARFFAVAARPISPKKAKEKLEWLDAIEAAYELGCTKPAITIKLTDHDTLLRDIVSIGSNYKQAKKILSFAKQLNIDTPVATAISYCALAALNAEDDVYLSKYIGEVMKAKNVPVVHQLCMKIMSSSCKFTDDIMEDVYACAMLNACDENRVATVDAVAESEKRLNEKRRQREMRLEDVPVSENVVGDPMYTPMRFYNTRNEISGDVKQKLTFFENNCKRDDDQLIKRLYAHESSTLALCLSLFRPDENQESQELSWTRNDKIRRYERGLRFLEDRIPLPLLVTAPASNIILEANKNDTSVTAIDRIEDYGCDRRRFMGDAEYRAETIIGLAGTTIDKVFEDALELANTYKVDEWQLHMASVEYLFDPMYEVPMAEVKRCMSIRKHLSKLRTRIDEFHARLRTMVLPSLEKNEYFIAYTSLFADTEPEKKVAPTIKKILEKKKNVEALKIWNDPKYLSELLAELPEKPLLSFISSFLLIPKVGAKGCERAAEILLERNANPYTVFLLMQSSVEEFLDLVSNKKSRDDEVAYLDQAVVILESNPNAPVNLRDAVRDRAERMHRASVTPEPAAAANGFGSSLFPSLSEDSSGMMKRRKN
ncbi:unnamed protein product [Caenorhabditis sp. 36 PRJEB53466]|nr:unnamed protein product [Caenorhabditis sp. 36 PRJEB53466]